MEINLLVLNVGNTRLAIGVFVAGELAHTARLNLAQQDLCAERIADAWDRVKDRAGAVVVGASVNPQALGELEPQVERICGQKVQWVGNQLNLPIKVLTDRPDLTGVDRIVNVAAAFEQMEKACVVVDAGTAITVDCCNDKGEFLGGAIAAGAWLSLNALHAHTASLPEVPFAEPTETFGKNTEQAMLQGAYYGARGLVRELVERYATELGFWPDVIATGGDAATLFEGWELIHAVAPDLTLYGIALAYSNHHIQHGT